MSRALGRRSRGIRSPDDRRGVRSPPSGGSCIGGSTARPRRSDLPAPSNRAPGNARPGPRGPGRRTRGGGRATSRVKTPTRSYTTTYDLTDRFRRQAISRFRMWAPATAETAGAKSLRVGGRPQLQAANAFEACGTGVGELLTGAERWARSSETSRATSLAAWKRAWRCGRCERQAGSLENLEARRPRDR